MEITTRNLKCALVVLIFLLLSLFAETFLHARVTASPSVLTVSQSTTPPSGSIIVPDMYPTINAAIGNASAGATVFVRNGVYRERIRIEKPLSLIGEDRQKTIIGEAPVLRFTTSYVIKVTAENVMISGFTIRRDVIGIWVNLENYQLPQPSRCRIVGNIIENNSDIGVSIQSGEEQTITGNNIQGNGNQGISIAASNSVISENSIAENGHQTEYGGTRTGISAYNGEITINNNNISSNNRGLELFNGPFDVYRNNITDNQEYGIQFADGCSNSLVRDNNIMRNGVGIDLKNFATEGVTVGSGNTVYRNNMINNSRQVIVNREWAYDLGHLPASNGTDVVSWDNGREGNYWSDYLSRYPNVAEVGTSEIGDTPYMIDENNVDHYPLLQSVDISAASLPPLTSFSDLLLTVIVVVVVVILAFVFLVYRIKRKGTKGSLLSENTAK